MLPIKLRWILKIPAFISNVINKVETARDTTFSSDVKANLNTLLSATIPLLKVYADASTTASVQRFAFSTLQNDVKDSTVMIGNASPTLLKYENNIFDYVATDQGIDEATINPDYNYAPTISSALLLVQLKIKQLLDQSPPPMPMVIHSLTLFQVLKLTSQAQVF